jgi:hypothetical protein
MIHLLEIREPLEAGAYDVLGPEKSWIELRGDSPIACLVESPGFPSSRIREAKLDPGWTKSG